MRLHWLVGLQSTQQKAELLMSDKAHAHECWLLWTHIIILLPIHQIRRRLRTVRIAALRLNCRCFSVSVEMSWCWKFWLWDTIANVCLFWNVFCLLCLSSLALGGLVGYSHSLQVNWCVSSCFVCNGGSVDHSHTLLMNWVFVSVLGSAPWFTLFTNRTAMRSVGAKWRIMFRW